PHFSTAEPRGIGVASRGREGGPRAAPPVGLAGVQALARANKRLYRRLRACRSPQASMPSALGLRSRIREPAPIHLQCLNNRTGKPISLRCRIASGAISDVLRDAF